MEHPDRAAGFPVHDAVHHQPQAKSAVERLLHPADVLGRKSLRRSIGEAAFAACVAAGAGLPGRTAVICWRRNLRKERNSAWLSQG
ncbi:hypothetical protein [Candidatus Electronema sp. JM]|uniref:hypothetical protein n=1 Tax=Candidatus Electronema sp. JM TaxID=3401571 RepID=UPI003AA97F2B